MVPDGPGSPDKFDLGKMKGGELEEKERLGLVA
jgi:hypothetical protein